MKKTNYDSFLSGKLTKGCELCVKGEKSVVYVTGLCGVGCKFCPLSNKRKDKDVQWINERPLLSIKDLIKEVKVSNAKGCSFTGGDPLLKLNRTIEYAKALKKEFGKNFHTHIYLATLLVTEEKLKSLSKVIDEVRFHPNFDKDLIKEVEKIKLAKKFWNKKNIGVEIPSFIDKKEKMYELIKLVENDISFLNLNELESGEWAEEYMLKNYKISKEGHTINNSIKAGLWLIKKLEDDKSKLNIHLCTAKLKNWHQYGNRLKNYKILPFSKFTDEGTIIYFATDYNKKLFNELPKKQTYFDKQKKRIIISEKLIDRVKPLYKIEEYPTFEREESTFEKIN